MEKHIFISYNRNDADFAEVLMSRIKAATNFEVWIDSEKIDAGEDWRVDIDQAIENAFALIVITTPDAKASEYVTYEWSFAWGAKVKVIPIVLKPVTLHPRLATLQYLDFTNHSSRPWNKLMDVLKRTSEEKYSSSAPLTQDISSAQVLEAAKALLMAIAHNLIHQKTRNKRLMLAVLKKQRNEFINSFNQERPNKSKERQSCG